jgi:hypothetical protein
LYGYTILEVVWSLDRESGKGWLADGLGTWKRAELGESERGNGTSEGNLRRAKTPLEWESCTFIRSDGTAEWGMGRVEVVDCMIV